MRCEMLLSETSENRNCLLCLPVGYNIQGNLVLHCNLNMPLVFGEELVAYGILLHSRSMLVDLCCTKF